MVWIRVEAEEGVVRLRLDLSLAERCQILIVTEELPPNAIVPAEVSTVKGELRNS